MLGRGRDQDQVALPHLLGVAGDRHRAGAADDHVGLLGLLVGAQRLLGPGRQREPGDGEVAGAEFARVHEDVRAQPVPLLDWCVLQTPDEHRRAFYQNRRGGRQRLQRTTRLTSLPGTTISFTTSLPSRCAPTFSLARASSSSSSSRGLRRRLDAVAQLAVDLDDQGHGVAGQQRRVGLGPGRSQTRSPSSRSNTSLPRCGAKGKISEAAVAVAKRTRGVAVGIAVEAVLEPVGVVDQLHHRRDRGVELEAALEVAGRLVDRPVGLGEQLARLARRRRARLAAAGPLRDLLAERARAGRGSG